LFDRGKQPFNQQMRYQLLQLQQADPQLRLGLPYLFSLECRVLALRNNDVATLEAYDQFISLPDFSTH
jgi:hypothetical protein